MQVGDRGGCPNTIQWGVDLRRGCFGTQRHRVFGKTLHHLLSSVDEFCLIIAFAFEPSLPAPFAFGLFPVLLTVQSQQLSLCMRRRKGQQARLDVHTTYAFDLSSYAVPTTLRETAAIAHFLQRSLHI